MAVGSFSSGQLLANYGWATVNHVVLLAVVVAALMLAWVKFFARARAV
jgi:hypothetical protein